MLPTPKKQGHSQEGCREGGHSQEVVQRGGRLPFFDKIGFNMENNAAFQKAIKETVASEMTMKTPRKKPGEDAGGMMTHSCSKCVA